jgi:hypothetical protein
MLRDLAMPVLWMQGWLSQGFVWRGTPMQTAESKGTA